MSPFSFPLEHCSSTSYWELLPDDLVFQNSSLVWHCLDFVFEVRILLHLFSDVSSMIRKKFVSAHMLPTTGNMINFAVQTVAIAFTSFEKVAGVSPLAPLVESYFCLNPKLRKLERLGSRAVSYVPLKQGTALETVLTPMHVGPSLESGTRPRFQKEVKAFGFLTYMIFFNFYRLISFVPFYWARSAAKTRWWCTMSRNGPSVVSGLLPCPVTAAFLVARASLSLPLLIELDKICTRVSIGPLPLQKWCKGSSEIANVWRQRGFIWERSRREQSSARWNDNVEKQQKYFPGDCVDYNHGNQASSAHFSQINIEGDSASTSSRG